MFATIPEQARAIVQLQQLQYFGMDAQAIKHAAADTVLIKTVCK